jgi:hypothetical protein
MKGIAPPKNSSSGDALYPFFEITSFVEEASATIDLVMV